MTTLSRATGKALTKSAITFKVVKDLVKKAVDKNTSTLVKSLAKNRAKMDDLYIDLCCCFEAYKIDTLTNDEITEDEFNILVEGKPRYSHNDAWLDEIKEEYYLLVDASDDMLEDMANSNTPEDASNLDNKVKIQSNDRLVSSLSEQVETSGDLISSSIDKLVVEVSKMEDNSVGPSKVLSLQSTLQNLDNKIDNQYSQIVSQLIAVLPDSEVKEKELMRKNFLVREKGRIDNLLINLSSKVKDAPPQFASPISGYTEKKEHTFLKKIDPPRWEGDPVEFSEFIRKWKSQISSANLPPESELDRLRDSIPVQASKALYGEKSMDGAWKILEALYGDKDLIANKLKIQLKSIKGNGKTDCDVVIDLVTDVNNIVLRLKAIEMEEALHVDNEFLAAVFRALPNHNQTKWLEYDKTIS